MHFEHPYFFYLLLLLIVLFFLKKQKIDYKRYFSQEMFERIFVNYKSSQIRFILLIVCYIFMVIAVASPVAYKAAKNITHKSISIVTALDMSKSMTTKDVYPSRFAFAKQKLLDFIKQEYGLSIAVIGFSDFPFLISASTDDKNALTYLVAHTKLNQINSQGTNLLTLLKGVNKLLADKRDKVVVIFTDGGHSGLLRKDISYAQKHKIHIFVYAVATLRGGVMQSNGKILTNIHHKIIITRLNQNIEKLCKQTGGAFFVMSTSSKDVGKLIRMIKSRYSPQSHNAKINSTYELYYIPLSIAIILFLLLFIGSRR